MGAQMDESLTSDEKSMLLRLAREALQATASGRSLPPVDLTTLPEKLRAPAASFVTLTRGGMLRGCIGGLQAQLPLGEDVRQHAVAAALDDFRFPPVQPNEVDEIEIEVSVLNEPRPLMYESPDHLVQLLRPGVDGVILSSGVHRATFLPQVWEKVPEAELFLSMLCEKAGLSSDAWRQADLQVYTYQVASFHEGSATQA